LNVIKRKTARAGRGWHPLLLPAMTLTTAIVLVLLLVFVLVNGQAISARYAPLLDDIARIKQQTTSAWVEFTADQQQPHTTDWQRLWQSLHHASVSSDTLEISGAVLPPRLARRLAPRLERMRQLLAKMVGSSIAYYQQRLAEPDKKVITGGRFGQHYLALLGTLREIEAALQASRKTELDDFQRQSAMLLGLAALLAIGLILLLRAVLANDQQQMSELRRATREIRKKNVLLEQLAYFDHLTGLPNSPRLLKSLAFRLLLSKGVPINLN